MAKIKTFQFPEGIDVPDENQVFKLPGGATGEIGYRKGNTIYTTSWMGAGDPYAKSKAEGIASGQKIYGDLGINYDTLPEFNIPYNDLTQLTNAGWTQEMMREWAKTKPSVVPGGTISKVVDPNNPHAFLPDIQGDVPADQLAPANFLQNLLGSGQGVGGAYTSNQSLAQTQAVANQQISPLQNEIQNRAGGQATIDKPYYRYENANEVYDSRTGKHITAEEAANIPGFWSQVEKVSPGASVAYGGANTSPGGNQSVNMGGSGASYDPNDPRAVLANTLKEQGEMMQKYFETLKSQPTAMDLFKQYSDQLGISSKSAQQTGLLSQVNKTEQILDNLEKNISTRITELGEGMSEAQRSRQYTTERKQPMEEYTKLVKAYNEGETSLTEARKQLGELMKYAQSDQQKAAELAYAPLEYSQKMLPILTEMAQYQTPAEKLADQIALKKATETTQTSVVEVNGRKLLIDDKTGDTIKDLGKASAGTTETNKALISAAISKAQPVLESSKRGGANIDGNEFLRLRTDYISTFGNATAFDAAFVPLLSETDRNKYFKTYKPDENSTQKLIDALMNLPEEE